MKVKRIFLKTLGNFISSEKFSLKTFSIMVKFLNVL